MDNIDNNNNSTATTQDAVSSPGASCAATPAKVHKSNGAKLGTTILKYHDSSDYGQILGDALKYALSRDLLLLKNAEHASLKLIVDVGDATDKLRELEDTELSGLVQQHADLLASKEELTASIDKMNEQIRGVETKIQMITTKNERIEANIHTKKHKHAALSTELEELQAIEKRQTTAMDDYKKMVTMYKENISNTSRLFKESNKNNTCELDDCPGDNSGGPKYTDNTTPCCRRRMCRACVRIHHDPESHMEKCLFCGEFINVYFLSSNQYATV